MHKIKILLIILFIFISLSSCSQIVRHEASELSCFDTSATLIAYMPQNDFDELKASAFSDLREYHKLYDIYNDYDVNNIKTINDNAGIKAVEVDKKIIDLLSYAKNMYYKTDGKMNIALGSVLKIWHDCREMEFPVLPTAEHLKSAALHTDIEKVIIDNENSTVYLEDEYMSLDVGAIGKGYAVEKICENLKKNGHDNFLFSVGGNIYAAGKKPNGCWKAGIKDPQNSSQIVKTFELCDKALVTSGVYERYFTVDGKDYNHIIDPTTLMPCENFLSVSVISSSSALCDSLSTSLCNMDFESGKLLLQNFNDITVFSINKNGKYEEYTKK